MHLIFIYHVVKATHHQNKNKHVIWALHSIRNMIINHFKTKNYFFKCACLPLATVSYFCGFIVDDLIFYKIKILRCTL